MPQKKAKPTAPKDHNPAVLFDDQIAPDFERLTEADLRHWLDELVACLEDQGAEVDNLETVQHDRYVLAPEGTNGAKKNANGDLVVNLPLTEARMEWRFPDVPPVPIVMVDADPLTAMRKCAKAAYTRRYENSPAMTGANVPQGA